MNSQPIPAVTRQDVVRIVRRDFPDTSAEEVLSILDEYGATDWQRERDRVQLAVLKLAAGNSQQLLHYLSVALRDYRDVLAWAEYATDFARPVGLNFKPGERERIYEDDWNQYSSG